MILWNRLSRAGLFPPGPLIRISREVLCSDNSPARRISSRMRSAVGPFQPLFEPAPNFLTDFRDLQNFVAVDFYSRPLRG
jgi:hypothetical protein